MNPLTNATVTLEQLIVGQNKQWQHEVGKVEHELDILTEIKTRESVSYPDLNTRVKDTFTIAMKNETLRRESPGWSFERRLSFLNLSDRYPNPTVYPWAQRLLGISRTKGYEDYRLTIHPGFSYYRVLASSVIKDRIVKLYLTSLDFKGLHSLFSATSQVLPNIRSISFDNCLLALTEDELKSLNKLKHIGERYSKLESLTFVGDLISNEIAKMWIKPFAKKVKKIRFHNCPKIDNNFGYSLPELLELTALHFNNCENLTYKCLKRFKFRAKKLTTLCLNNSLNNSEETIIKIIKYRNPLIKLSLSNHKYVTDDHLAKLAAGLGETLISLDLSGCTQITDEAMEALVVQCPNLSQINLERCSKLTNKSIRTLLRDIKVVFSDSSKDNLLHTSGVGKSIHVVLRGLSLKLTSINLEGCDWLEDDHIQLLANRFRTTLTTLSLKYCKKISDLTVDILVRHCPNLSKVSIVECSRFTLAGLKTLIQKVPSLMAYYQKGTMKGSVWSQSTLGTCYDTGIGVDMDSLEAVNLYQKAAVYGLASAQFNLGTCFDIGIGVEKDELEAFRLYEKAANQGIAAAQFNLGLIYQTGTPFVLKDDIEAVKWYQKAAEQGLACAQSNLGWCYENGMGVPKDQNTAFNLYKLAAEQGDEQAQRNLIACYALGIGVAVNEKEAGAWYAKTKL